MIIKYLENLFDKKEPTFIEWRTDDSIYRLLASNIDADGKLNKTAENLPDEKTDGDELKFASGLMDSLFGAEDSPDSRKKISRLARHLKKIAIQGDRNSEQELYKMVTDGESLTGIIDKLLAKLNPRSLPVQPYLFNFAKDLATKTDQRNAVKFGIAILGLCQEKSALNDIKIDCMTSLPFIQLSQSEIYLPMLKMTCGT